MKYKKKPVVIEAIQWTGDNKEEINAFCGDKARWEFYPLLYIDTLEGLMRANPNSMIIRGVDGEFYPCREDIFIATYDKAEEE